MSNEELAAGLIANMPRIRARRTMDMANAFAIGNGADITDVAPIMRLAGASENQISKALLDQVKHRAG